MWSFGIALITGLTLLLMSGEALGEMGGPPGTGPHSVGSTFLLELDHSRQHQNGAARPVPVVVFYPVDADKTIGALPARYPRNPFANQQSEVFLSTGWAVSREPFAMFFVNERQNGQLPPPDDDFPDESWFHFSQPDKTSHPDPYENRSYWRGMSPRAGVLVHLIVQV